MDLDTRRQVQQPTLLKSWELNLLLEWLKCSLLEKLVQLNSLVGEGMRNTCRQMLARC